MTESELFDALGSGVVALAAVAVLVMGAVPAPTVYVACTVFDCAGVMLPRLHGKVVHAPVALTNVRRAGVGSSSETLEASEGPLLVTLMVNVTVLPIVVIDGPVLLTTMSAF